MFVHRCKVLKASPLGCVLMISVFIYEAAYEVRSPNWTSMVAFEEAATGLYQRWERAGRRSRPEPHQKDFDMALEAA